MNCFEHYISRWAADKDYKGLPAFHGISVIVELVITNAALVLAHWWPGKILITRQDNNDTVNQSFFM